MFSEQFEIIEDNEEHIQFKHLNIDNEEFNRYIVEAIFKDKELYKYVTNDIDEPIDELSKKYPIMQLINLIKNLKKQYISEIVPRDTRKKLCKELRATVNGEKIDVRKDDWEEKFQIYLDNNITSSDVVAEIILSKIIEEKFSADVFVTKLAQTTSNNMKVFGVDTLHYNQKTNTIFFGESKLTNTIELGLNEHKIELLLTDYKLNEECKLFALRGNDMRGHSDTIKKAVTLGKKLTVINNLSFFKFKFEDNSFNYSLVYFVAHGDKYDYDYVTEKIINFRKSIEFKNIDIYCVTLPIKDKGDFVKRVQEVINEYE